MSNIQAKRCSKCGLEKDLGEFSKDSSKSDGLYSSCKVCCSLQKRMKPLNRKQLDSHNRVSSIYRTKLRASNPEKLLLQRTSYSANQRGLEFNLDLTDITIPEVCPILKTPLDKFVKKGPNGLSLDRIDNTKGYIKGNVAVISQKANMMKRDNTIETLEAIIQYIKQHTND